MTDFEARSLDTDWKLETPNFAADWRGLLFVRGHRAGNESVARLAAELHTNGPERTLALARGSFSLKLLDKRSAITFFCSDPFGLVQVFAGGDRIGSDLIHIVRTLARSEAALDRVGVASFLRYGSYTLGRTLDERIRVLGGDEIVVCTPGNIVQRLRKAGTGPKRSAFDFDSYLADLKIAVSEQSISVDLTGGIDSRVVGAGFSHAGIPISEFATMGTGAQEDMAIAEQVAAVLKVPHRRAEYAEVNFEQRIPDLLAITNGQVGLATYDHAFQFARERLEHGISLAVSGAGGELWKDFWWLQDFPFLSGRPNLQWLYHTRIEPRCPETSIFTPTFDNLLQMAREEYLGAMGRFSSMSKTQAYDSVYAALRVPFVTGPWVSATLRAGLPTLCPLLDIDGVRAAMQMPRHARLFGAWHRQTIARLAPSIAPLRTAEGTTTRTGLGALADIPSYVADKSVRLAQKVAQRLGHRDLIRRSLFDARAFRTDAVHELARRALATLARFGVVRENLEPAELSFSQFERVLTAGLLLNEIY